MLLIGVVLLIRYKLDESALASLRAGQEKVD
jgi:hypothetical protein